MVQQKRGTVDMRVLGIVWIWHKLTAWLEVWNVINVGRCGATAEPVSPDRWFDTESFNQFSPQYVGCYKRSELWDFPQQLSSVTSHSVDTCVTHCRHNNYAFAAVQFNATCLCGDSYYQTHSTSCRDHRMVKCPGEQSQLCGGSDGAVDVYRVCMAAYGTQCKTPCSNCLNQCYMNGTCMSGCGIGQEKHIHAQTQQITCSEGCDEPNRYGMACKHINPNCKHGRAHPGNGYCLLGCERGYGPFCDSDPASKNRASGKCPVCSQCKNGICPGLKESTYYDCPLQWQGIVCTECPEARWGNFCNHVCSANCAPDGNTIRCERKSGQCSIGCNGGFYSSHCNVTCPEGCVENCHQATGRCDACEESLYGEHCDKACSMYCQSKQCKQNSGGCIGGCMDGFTGSRCESCIPGHHGQMCNQRCPRFCIGENCDRSSGMCTEGCGPGFTSMSCNNSCPVNCMERICHQHTMFCTQGCTNGFTGAVCVYQCPDYCTNSTCDQKTRDCKYGCYGTDNKEICPQGVATQGSDDETMITDDDTGLGAFEISGIVLAVAAVIAITVVIYKLLTSEKKEVSPMECELESISSASIAFHSLQLRTQHFHCASHHCTKHAPTSMPFGVYATEGSVDSTDSL